MKKLNNRGWSFREMIFILCGLFLALAVAVYYIHVLYDGYAKEEAKAKEKVKEEEKENNTSTTKEETTTTPKVTTNYELLEKKLSQSALNYVVDLNENITNDFTLTVTFTELKNNDYVDNLIEEENKSECDGYATVYAEDGNLYSDPYITCSQYQTPNFESWRLN